MTSEPTIDHSDPQRDATDCLGREARCQARPPDDAEGRDDWPAVDLLENARRTGTPDRAIVWAVTTPPAFPPRPPCPEVSTSGEREVLEAFLDFYRRVVIQKVSGLSEEDAKRRLVPSMTTLAGLVKHLIGVERGWFERRLAQRSADAIVGIVGGGDDSWVVTADDTVDALIAEYEQTCQQSRLTAARFDLDDVVPHPRLGRVSLRWIYVHMIEETARHAGHADILREQTDGATG
jgi:uncharacterized damage-inducible protein DinB